MAKKSQDKQKIPRLIQSRIVGHGDIDPTQLLANPLNFRRHPGPQMDALRGSMSELGWIKTILVNRTTGHVLDGHARVEEAMRQNLPTIPVTLVELSEAEERLALAVLDPITEMATRDDVILSDLISQVSTDDDGLQYLLDTLLDKEADEESSDNIKRDAKNGKYTAKVTTPVYSPKGDKPDVAELWNPGKAKELTKKIMDSDIPDDVRSFLLHAAMRHVVFNYKLIAEYYCHATPDIQDLMEQSALVIIDFGKAIENGYVRLTETMMKLAGEDGDPDVG